MNRHEGGGHGAQGPASIMTVLANIDWCGFFFFSRKSFLGEKKESVYLIMCVITHMFICREETPACHYTQILNIRSKFPVV